MDFIYSNRATAQPRNRATAQPRNRATAQPRNRATANSDRLLSFADSFPSVHNTGGVLNVTATTAKRTARPAKRAVFTLNFGDAAAKTSAPAMNDADVSVNDGEAFWNATEAPSKAADFVLNAAEVQLKNADCLLKDPEATKLPLFTLLGRDDPAGRPFRVTMRASRRIAHTKPKGNYLCR
jgi:hypothetical protein